MATQINVSWLKVVDEWSEETGAAGRHRIVDMWASSALIEVDATEIAIRNAIEAADRYGVIKALRYWSEEPGRFTTDRLERNDGSPDDHGRWLADYDVRVTTRQVSPEVPISLTLGFPNVDG